MILEFILHTGSRSLLTSPQKGKQLRLFSFEVGVKITMDAAVVSVETLRFLKAVQIELMHKSGEAGGFKAV